MAASYPVSSIDVKEQRDKKRFQVIISSFRANSKLAVTGNVGRDDDIPVLASWPPAVPLV